MGLLVVPTFAVMLVIPGSVALAVVVAVYDQMPLERPTPEEEALPSTDEEEASSSSSSSSLLLSSNNKS